MSARRTSPLAGPALGERRAAITAEMRAVLDACELSVLDHARYHLGWRDEAGAPADIQTGKMLRPLLTLLACEIVAGRWEPALPAAAAVELLHNFSLIHDDVEDRSRERHHRPTLWTLCGVPRAVNAGDALFVCARQALGGLRRWATPAETLVLAWERFDEASLRLCEGQEADLRFESELDVTLDDYRRMIAGKTGALMGLALELGALAGRADSESCAAFRGFGQSLGIAFQMQDDLLGVWGAEDTTGKAADDLAHRKRGLPLVLAMSTFTGADKAALNRLLVELELPASGVGQLAGLIDGSSVRTVAEQLIAAQVDHVQAELSALRRLSALTPALDQLARLAAFATKRDH